MKTLETERLVLRDVQESDAADIFNILSDEETCLDDGAYHAPKSPDDESFYNTMEFCTANNEHYLVVEKASGRGVGLVHLMKGERAVKALELGYVIGKDCRRRGYAKEAVQAVIDWYSREEGVKLFCAECYDYNAASQAALESLGFVWEGMRHQAVDHPKYGIIDMLLYYLPVE